MTSASDPASPDDVAARLRTTGYLADPDLATVTFLAMKMQRPLLVEGEPGTGKTALAEAIAAAFDLPLVRLQCYEGIDATQALYDWDFPRQILHLRALEATGRVDPELLPEAEKSLYDERFLLARPVLDALQRRPALLLRQGIGPERHARTATPEVGEPRQRIPGRVTVQGEGDELRSAANIFELHGAAGAPPDRLPRMRAAAGIEEEIRDLLRSRSPLARSLAVLPGDLPLGTGGLGLDSISLVELLLDCEESFGIAGTAGTAGLLDGPPLTVDRLLAHVRAGVGS